VFDHCANGQRLKCLTVVDEFTRECLAIDVAGSIRSPRVIEVLAQLVSVHGAPAYLHYNEVRPHSSLGYRTPAQSERSNRAPSGRHSPVIPGPKKPGRSVPAEEANSL
jgi:transposase InsO family protein